MRDGEPLEAQPVVFVGSEGELEVLAPNLSGFLWLLADGASPLEPVDLQHPGRTCDEAAQVATRFATPPRPTVADVRAAARAEFPDFEATILALSR